MDGWMDELPAMETDDGRAVMTTPTTEAKALFKGKALFKVTLTTF